MSVSAMSVNANVSESQCEDCPICLLDSTIGTGHLTTCDHWFHMVCLRKWIVSLEALDAPFVSCPICRQRIEWPQDPPFVEDPKLSPKQRVLRDIPRAADAIGLLDSRYPDDRQRFNCRYPCESTPFTDRNQYCEEFVKSCPNDYAEDEDDEDAEDEMTVAPYRTIHDVVKQVSLFVYSLSEHFRKS